MKLILSLTLYMGCAMLLQAQTHLKLVQIPSGASFRGISAVSKKICWVSGSEGSVFRTLDRGKSWQDLSPEGYDEFEFRDIETFGADTAYLLSAGSPAVLLLTTDGGQSWSEAFRDDRPEAFYDAIDFFENGQGVFFGDASTDRLPIVMGRGLNWQPQPDSLLPKVLEGQGGFAASGSCLQVFGDSNIAIVLGGVEASFLLSQDRGRSWSSNRTPLDFGAPTRGNFSLAVLNDSSFLVSGGDYRADSLSTATVAITTDYGENWELIPNKQIQGRYFSAVVSPSEGEILLVSRFSCYYRQHKDANWEHLNHHFFSADVASDGGIWTSGSSGAAAYLVK